MTAPTRIVTTTVRIKGGTLPALSVKTKDGVPKDKITECISCLQEVETEAPVCVGDVIVEDIAGTGVSVVATKSIERYEEL